MYYLYSNFINFTYSLFYSLCESTVAQIWKIAAEGKVSQIWSPSLKSSAVRQYTDKDTIYNI